MLNKYEWGKTAQVMELYPDGFIHVWTENFRYDFQPAFNGFTAQATRYDRKGGKRIVTVKNTINGFEECEAVRW